MDPDHIAKGDGKKAVRVVFPQIILGGKGQRPQFKKRSETVRINLHLLEFLSVKRDMGGDTIQG